jgi:hypothetical protein
MNDMKSRTKSEGHEALERPSAAKPQPDVKTAAVAPPDGVTACRNKIRAQRGDTKTTQGPARPSRNQM